MSADARDPYAVLGVDRGAPTAEIRQAWLRAARESHPDRHLSEPAAVQRMHEDRMRRVNEAWRILGAPALRADLDREVAEAAEAAAKEQRRRERAVAEEWEPPAQDPPGFMVKSPRVATAMRIAPWLIVGGLGLGIFIFTAFAGGGRNTEPASPVDAVECVRIRDDGTVRPVPCGWTNDGVVDQYIPLDTGERCRHPAAREHEAPVHNAKLCLVPVEVARG